MEQEKEHKKKEKTPAEATQPLEAAAQKNEKEIGCCRIFTMILYWTAKGKMIKLRIYF